MKTHLLSTASFLRALGFSTCLTSYTLSIVGIAHANDECGAIAGANAVVICDGITGNAGSDGSSNVTAGSDSGDASPGNGFTYLEPDGLTVNVGSDGAPPLAINGRSLIQRQNGASNIEVNLADNVTMTSNTSSGAFHYRGQSAIAAAGQTFTLNSAADITNNGTGTFRTAIQAQTNFTDMNFNLTGGTITTLGDQEAAIGLWAFNDGGGGDINVNTAADWVVGTAGVGTGRAQAIYLVDFGGGDETIRLNMTDGDITVFSATWGGAIAIDTRGGDDQTDVQISTTGTIETFGDWSTGINVRGGITGTGDQFRLSGTTIRTHGAQAHAISYQGGGVGASNFHVENANIQADGDESDGISTSLFGDGAKSFSIVDTAIHNSGDEASSIDVTLSSNIGTPGTATLRGLALSSTGEDATGLAFNATGGLDSSLAIGSSENNDTTITMDGDNSIGVQATRAGTWNAGESPEGTSFAVTLEGDSQIVTAGANSHAVIVRAQNEVRNLPARMAGTAGVIYPDLMIESAADIEANGADSNGLVIESIDRTTTFVPGSGRQITSSANETKFHLNVSGGKIVGGAGTGAAIRSYGGDGSTISIADDAMIDGSASGTAIVDGTTINLTNEASDLTITNQGTIVGDSYLGLGNDVFVLASGSVTGNIYGDGQTASENDGDDEFVWSGGTLNSGFYGANGSDTVAISDAARYDGTETLDGGDDVSTIDGWTDQLTFTNIDADAQSGSVTNWENIVVDGGRLSFGDQLSAGSEEGHGLVVTNGGILDGQDQFELSGNLSISNGARFTGQGGGAGIFRFSHAVAIENGTLDLRDGFTGDRLIIEGAYRARDAALGVDVDFSTDSADVLELQADAQGTTELLVSDVTSGKASGNDVQVVQTNGQTGQFILGQPFVSGQFVYDLELIGANWFLTGELASVDDIPVSSAKTYAHHLMRTLDLPTYRQRVGQRLASNTPELSRFGLWTRVEGAQENALLALENETLDFSQNRWQAEAGLDGLAYDGHSGQLIGGFLVGYGSASSTTNAQYDHGTITTDFWLAGANLTWEGDNGLYLDGQARAYWLESDVFLSEAEHTIDGNDGSGYVFSLEAGKVFDIGQSGLVVTPQAQLVYGQIDFDEFVIDQEYAIGALRDNALNARIGLSVESSKRGVSSNGNAYFMNGYGIANLHYALLDTPSVRINNQGAALDSSDIRGELGVGAQLNWADNRYSVNTEIRLASGLESLGDDVRAAGQIGFKIRW